MYALNAIHTDNNDASLGEYLGVIFDDAEDAEGACRYVNDLHGDLTVEVVEVAA